MAPDEVSAYGSLGAAAIALLALGVSVYAAVVARRGAVATVAQARIAQQTLQLAATPKIFIEFVPGAYRPGDDLFSWEVKVVREGGPYELLWKWEYDFLFRSNLHRGLTDDPVRSPKGRNFRHWFYDGDEHFISDSIPLDDKEILTFFELRLRVEMTDPLHNKALDVNDRLVWSRNPTFRWPESGSASLTSR